MQSNSTFYYFGMLKKEMFEGAKKLEICTQITHHIKHVHIVKSFFRKKTLTRYKCVIMMGFMLAGMGVTGGVNERTEVESL